MNVTYIGDRRSILPPPWLSPAHLTQGRESYCLTAAVQLLCAAHRERLRASTPSSACGERPGWGQADTLSLARMGDRTANKQRHVLIFQRFFQERQRTLPRIGSRCFIFRTPI